MPEFISLLRDIRDRMYVEIKTAYDTYLTISVGSTTNIDPIAGVVQPATVTYDPLTGELDFGIPTSPIIDNTDASLIRANGTIPMDPTYVPAVAKDVATKESSELYTDQELETIQGTLTIANSATEVTTTSEVMTKVKEIRAGRNGSARLVFELASSGGLVQVAGQIYINGIAIGTIRETILETYTTYSENFTVEGGDLIQLYISTTSGVDTPAYARNLEYKIENPLVATVTL